MEAQIDNGAKTLDRFRFGSVHVMYPGSAIRKKSVSFKDTERYLLAHAWISIQRHGPSQLSDNRLCKVPKYLNTQRTPGYRLSASTIYSFYTFQDRAMRVCK